MSKMTDSLDELDGLLDELADIVEDNLIKQNKTINIGTVLTSEKGPLNKIKIGVFDEKGFIPQNEKDVEGLELLLERNGEV